MLNKRSEYYDKRYREMVGKVYGKLTVISYEGLMDNRGVLRRTVRARCECGSEGLYEACRIQNHRISSCPKCHKARGKTRETLCWTCDKATDSRKCPWAGGRERDDWEAIPRDLDYDRSDGTHCSIKSYVIIKCPGYVPDRREAERNAKTR